MCVCALVSVGVYLRVYVCGLLSACVRMSVFLFKCVCVFVWVWVWARALKQ